MTARSIARLLPAGAEVDGAIRFDGRDVYGLRGGELRRYRSEVAMVFQDPRAHINPVRRIGDFMTEALRTNRRRRPADRRARRWRCSDRSGSTTASGACGSTRTSSRAACCSG